jgi:hypothetical protein
MDSQELKEVLVCNTSLNYEEAKQFIDILVKLKDISNVAILDEYWDNWSAFDSYEDAWKDEQSYDDEQTEDEFKEHSFSLSSGRCLVRDYK